jgi:hypothetical protein
MKSRHAFALGLIAGCALLAAPAMAEDSVAMVEDVTGTAAGVNLFQYLQAGTVIKLAPADKLVLDYFRSCARETITGGTVTIGNEGSAVAGGAKASEKVVCDGGQYKLTTSQAMQSGTVVFRAAPKAGQPDAVERTLFNLSPIFDLGGPTTRLLVEEIDKPGRRIDLRLSEKDLVQGRFYDFAQHDERLVAGATYRVTANRRSVVFRIDPTAKAASGALAGRLVQL